MQRFTLAGVLAMALVVLSNPAVSAEIPDINIEYEKFTLDNGLTVVVHEDRKAPIVAVSIWYHVGSKNEPQGKTGFAHLFEHLMFNGSENYDGEYFEPFEQVGATGMNGTTWFDRTNYFETVPTPALEMALWMESDRMGHLLGAVTQEKLDNQIGVVQNEKRQGDNQPYGKVNYEILEGLFPPGHPYRHSTIGSMEDLSAASLETVHQWFKDYYGAANTVLVMAGDVGVEQARELAQKYFGHIDAGPPVTKMKAAVPVHLSDTLEVMYDRVPQARVFHNWVAPGRTTRDAAMLQLAAAVLGSGKNSRMYQALVYNNQLAVNVSVGAQRQELATLFDVDVTLQPDASMDEVNAIIERELQTFLREGPTEEELQRVVTRINASTVRGLEQIGGFGGKAVTLAQGELYADDPGFFQTRLEWFNEATPADVKNVANEWLTKGRYTLEVYPFGDFTTSESMVDRSTGIPAVGDMPDLTFPEVQRAELDNGMSVVLAERDAVPVVNVALQFDAGYAADSTGTLGAASFTMAMLDEGTKDRDALEISAEAESLGANISTGSNLDTSTVRLSALKTNLEPSLDLFAEIVREPTFPEDEIERLRKRWYANIEQEKNQPVQIALRTLPPLMYGDDHAYGIPFTGSGTEESIASLDRDALVDWHQTWIRPNNATLFVVGDTTMDEILPMLEKRFGKWRDTRQALPEKNLADVALRDSAVYIIDKPGAPQSLILAGHVAPPTGVENNIDIVTMNDVIGGSFTARVNMNLREDKGWAYGAGTFMQDARGQRPWLAYAPVQTDKTTDSIKELTREFDEYLGTRPATQDELNKSVRNNVNSLPGQFETAGAVMGALLSNQRFGRSDDHVTTLKGQYEAVNLEGVQGAAEQVMHPDKLTWLIVGDREKIESQVRELGLGEVSILDTDGNIVE
ncbi:MAG: insulinase family protein [Xanthomonadales bacterium]|nr:insulinase family protein [Gammaproteobacteria bacterium]NNL04123.1 insulinase family protein [Xanthomonadales bacterium]